MNSCCFPNHILYPSKYLYGYRHEFVRRRLLKMLETAGVSPAPVASRGHDQLVTQIVQMYSTLWPDIDNTATFAGLPLDCLLNNELAMLSQWLELEISARPWLRPTL